MSKTTKLTTGTVRRRYTKIKLLADVEQSRHLDALTVLRNMLAALRKRCPHEHTDSGNWTRWCDDCGETWDI